MGEQYGTETDHAVLACPDCEYRVVDVLASAARHPGAIAVGWIAPALVVLFAPEPVVLPLLVGLFGLFLVLHWASTTRLPD